MSKLDKIIDDIASDSPIENNDELKGGYKKEIKDLFIEILDTTDVLGPEHPQTNIWYRGLKQKIEEL